MSYHILVMNWHLANVDCIPFNSPLNSVDFLHHSSLFAYRHLFKSYADRTQKKKRGLVTILGLPVHMRPKPKLPFSGCLNRKVISSWTHKPRPHVRNCRRPHHGVRFSIEFQQSFGLTERGLLSAWWHRTDCWLLFALCATYEAIQEQ